ncbi:MAG: DNA-binding protein [Thermodesulfobacteriota bacterium]
MSFNWVEFLGFAQSLIGDFDTRPHGEEAKFRAAVSRAYYAAHGMAREKLKHEGHTVPTKRAHQYVIDAFRNSRDKSRIRIADDLNVLLSKRIKADYRADAIIQVATAKLASQLAEGIIQGIETLAE